MKMKILALVTLLLLLPGAAAAGSPDGQGFTVHITAAAEEEVENDLLVATLTVERTGDDSAVLAGEVAEVMGRALVEGGAFPGVTLKTAAYTTRPVYERDRDGSSRRSGWQVVQTLSLESTGIDEATTLIGRLQKIGMQMTAMAFTVSPELREMRRAALVGEAIDRWKERAEAAVVRLGGRSWQPFEVSIQDDGYMPVRPMAMRADLMAAEAMPPAVEAGTSRLRVSVSGSVTARW